MITTPYTIEYYETPQGESPFIEWLESLDFPVRVKIQARIDRFETGNLGDHSPIKGHKGLYEARLTQGPGYRMYFSIEDKRVILLYVGGDKGSQRRDIAKAAGYMKRRQSNTENGDADQTVE